MLGAQGIRATGFKCAQGNAHCAKFESHTNRVTFETNAIRMTSSVQALRRTSRSCIGKKDFFFITDSRCPERPVAWSVQQYQEIHLVLMYPLRQCSNESSMSAYTYDLLNEFWHAFWLRKRALTQGLAMYYRIDNTDNTLQNIFSSLVSIFIQYY